MVSAAPGPEHGRDLVLQAEKDTAQVDGDDLVEILDRKILDTVGAAGWSCRAMRPGLSDQPNSLAAVLATSSP